MAPLIGYWKLRALVEPVLLTLRQAQQPYERKEYFLGDAPDYDKSAWLSEKHKLGLDYPNLPYYMDGDLKITQTLAILRYLARKHDLGPKGEEETIRSDVVEQGGMEIMLALFRTWYTDSDEDYKRKVPFLNKYLVEKMEHTAAVLGSGHFFLGDRVTYIDFLLYSALDYIRLYGSEFLEPHQNLRDFLDRIEALPNVEPYFKAETFTRFPITGTMAKFGNGKQQQQK